MRRLIYTSYASNNRQGNSTYLKCCAVSLISFRQWNPDDDIALFTNIDLNDEYETMFSKNRIAVKKVPFDSFVFPKDMLWSLAFYKLCVLDYIVKKTDYDLFLGVDSDTVCIKNLCDLWIEASEHILLYNLHHSFSHPQSVQMDKEYYSVTGKQKHLTNYGGEFIAGPRNLLILLTEKCEDVYQKMNVRGLKTMHGDEFILCAASDELKHHIESGNAYLFRFFTGKFYLSSTVYKYNQVAIMHLPSEKNNGFRLSYAYYSTHSALPPQKTLLKMMEIQTAERPVSFYRILYTVWNLVRRIRDRVE